MRINQESHLRAFVTVYLNNVKVEDCVEASEEDSYVWVGYRNAEGFIVHEWEAEKGALIYECAQVIKLTGKVRIEIDAGPFAPIQPIIK